MEEIGKRLWRRHPAWILVEPPAITRVVAYDPTNEENTSGDTTSIRDLPIAIIKHLRFNFVKLKFEGVHYALWISLICALLCRQGYRVPSGSCRSCTSPVSVFSAATCCFRACRSQPASIMAPPPVCKL